MPKPHDDRLKLFPALRDIPAEEWDEVFDRDGEPWTTKESEYLVEWFGRENIVDLAYQLGRTPYSIHKALERLRSYGWNIPYLRKERMKD